MLTKPLTKIGFKGNRFLLTVANYLFLLILKEKFELPWNTICCTVNIVATSLEAGHLLRSSFFDDLDLKKLLSSATTGSVYRPSLSTNQIADLCLRQEEIPSDIGEHGEGVCPFLDQEGLCSVYEYRPFACRAMSSREVCQYGGEADMEPFLVTVNLAVYQIIEHLDKEGVSGNLLDVLSELVNNQSVSPGPEDRLISNRALPGFLVTPDEQGRFRAFMRRLADFQVGDTTLGALLPGLFVTVLEEP